MFLTGDGGVVTFPPPGGQETYSHGLSCAWLIKVNRSMVITVQFTHFDLEDNNCNYDWLQVINYGFDTEYLH